MALPHRLAHHIGIACLLTLPGAPALAGRPLVTEDADVLDRAACEWESVGQRLHGAGEPATLAWTTQFGCGTGLNSQAALFVGRSSTAGAATLSLGLGGKTALLARQGSEGLGLTVAWGLVGLRPAGERLGHELSYLNLVATQALGDALTAHANLGWTHARQAGQATTNWNLALEWSRGTGLDWLGEVYGDDRSRPWLGLGLRWAASPAWSLNASWARQQDLPRVKLFSVGAKFSF